MTNNHTSPAGPGAAGFRLAHISDPHLTSLAGIHLRDLLNKRLLGWLSWNLKRRHVHRAGVLDTLLQDLQQQKPDHIAVTGDLTQLGTVPECRQARSWLDHLGPPGFVTVIPGNHDYYAPGDPDASLGQWTEYMRGDETVPRTGIPSLFPALRVRHPVALIGLSTARPTAPFLASGRLGGEQLERLDRLLEQTAEQGCFRIILLHHGPVPGTYSRRRSLDDDHRFCEIIRHRGAEMVLHGHGHRGIRHFIHGDSADVPVFGAASASSADSDPEKRAACNLYDITGNGREWQLTMTPRIYDIHGNAFFSGKSCSLTLPVANPVAA